MMDPRLANLTVNLQHRHNDGSWSPLRRKGGHDPAGSDPEREWAAGHVFECATCGEEVQVEIGSGPGGGGTPRGSDAPV